MLLVTVSVILAMTGRAQTSAVRPETRIENSLIDAVALFEASDIASASAIFQRLHAADSTNDAVCYYLGMCQRASGRPESAQEFLSMAVGLDSANVWYRNALANLYIETGKALKAAPLMEKLVRDCPQSYSTPYTFTLIGDSYSLVRRDSTVLSWYERALDLDPDYAPAEMGRAEYMRSCGNLPAFFVSLGKVIRNRDVTPSAKSSYLKNLLQQMDARTWWVWGIQYGNLVYDCVAMHPEDLEARWLKVDVCAIREQWDEALSECRTILEMSSGSEDKENYVRACSTCGDILHEQKGDEKGCFKMYELALERDPEYVPVLNNYAYYLCEKGKKLRKSLKMSQVTIEKAPDNATYLDTYAWILHLLGRDSEAKPYFKHALIYGGRDSKVVLGHYSEVLDSLGEKDLAEYYRRLSEKQ